MATPAPASKAKEEAQAPIDVAVGMTLEQLEAKLASVQATKDANAAKGKELDEKLRRAFKSPPKRPNMTIPQIDEEMDKLETRRTTVSMSLNDEKYILRELQMLQERKSQVAEYERFQQWVDATKKERTERFAQHRNFDDQLQQLKAAMKKVALATKLQIAVTDFVTVELTAPEDRMGSVVGKGFANARRIEEECGVLLETENKSTRIRICGPAANAEKAKKVIENITLATSHTIGLHPDAVKLLMAQKGKILQELEHKLRVKIDINKVDGLLSTTASPGIAADLEKTIAGLTEGTTEIQLPPEIVPKLIGKKGETINQLMEDTGCLVDIDKVTNAVRLCGARENVAMAKRFVNDLIEQQSQREKVFSVENNPTIFDSPDFAAFKFDFFVEFLMSNKAQQLKLLRTDAAEAKIQVQRESQAIHVTGNKQQLEAMDEALRERLREFDAHHWLYHVADTHVLSLIIGKKGQQIKDLEAQGKDAHVRVEIRGPRVCVLGDTPAAIAEAKEKILAIVDQNQRAPYSTSQHLVALLLADKRAKLTEIESSTGCRVHLPPPPSTPATGKSSRRVDSDEPVKIMLHGSFDAIAEATSQLDALDEAHHVRYLPLDDDEVPTVIGKKGETISELEKKSGAKLRVLRSAESAELEMLGTDEQLAAAQAAIDVLLQTANRRLLELDGFSAGCLIGKKGERIHALREKHPDATVDAFPARGQVRVKATTPEALDACVEDIQQTLRETIVVESVRSRKSATGLSGSANFNTVLEKHAAIAARLHELEAEGGEQTKVSFQEEGKVAKVRGPVLAVGKLKRFLEMLVTPDAAFVETIPLPTLELASVLLVKGETEGAKLNENAARICKQTGCAIRVKRAGGSTPSGVIRIEGSDAATVFETKHQVETLLEFYHDQCFRTLEKLPDAVIPRLYDLLPELSTQYHVVFSLPDRTSLRIFADGKATVTEVVKRVQTEIKRWEQQHVQVEIPGWLVPVLVGKNGETIKKLSAETPTARLDLSSPTAASATSRSTRIKFEAAEPRKLTISAKDDDTTQQALKNVQQFLKTHENRTSSVEVPVALLDLALNARKDAPNGIQFHVMDAEGTGTHRVVLYGGELEAREALVERIESMVETSVVDTIALPPAAGKGVVGALIGKGGANIRTLQQEFPRVAIDIRKDDNVVKLTGPSSDVLQVKRVMEDKVQELVHQEEAFQQQQQQQRKPPARDGEGHAAASGSGRGAEEHHAVSNENDAPGNQTQNHAAPVPPQRSVPVGGTDMGQLKLTKNQRRRMRKRAENEKKSDVLRMLVGGSPVPEAMGNSKTEAATQDDSGYYHSTSGYSLRL